MKEPIKKKIWIAAAVFFALLFIASSVLLVMNLRGKRIDTDKYKKSDVPSSDTTTAPDSSQPGETEPTSAPEPTVANPIDFDRLVSENPDIYAWIIVPGTPIDYPVVQSDISDEYYLRRDYLGKASISGCIFTQFYNKKDFSDRNTIVYGHYMWDDTFFGSLHKFRDPEFFDNNSEITVYTADRKLTYEIFAAYEYDNRHILFSFDFTDDAVYEAYLQSCLASDGNAHNVRQGTVLTKDDKIITLSTCTQNSDPNKRYLVQGVLRKNEKAG